MMNSSTRACTVSTGGRPAGDDGPEDQIAGQQVPEFVGDGGLGDLAAVDGLLQYVLDQGLALIEELMLQGVVERGVARHLDEHRADGAGVLAGLLAARSRPSCSRSPRSVPVFGGTATWRTPSMNAANTNSAFDGQRRYTVALLARAALATASTVNRS